MCQMIATLLWRSSQACCREGTNGLLTSQFSGITHASTNPWREQSSQPCCRVDHMASYGQLVGQPAYDDSGLFNRHGGAPEGTEAASSSSTPALKITITDPLKKVN